jgi:hypothetical protein
MIAGIDRRRFLSHGVNGRTISAIMPGQRYFIS